MDRARHIAILLIILMIVQLSIVYSGVYTYRWMNTLIVVAKPVV